MVERQLISLPSQLQLIDRLQHLIYLTSSLIFVSGEQGAGKTALIEQLSNKLPNDIKEVFIRLNDQLSNEQIRQQIISQLYDQPLFNAQDNLFSSLSLLQEKHNTDTPRLLILDNAHHLANELLAELVQLITQKEQLGESEINVLLLGDESTNQKMLTLINQQNHNSQSHCACLEFKLEALSNDESTKLINHIFKQTAYQAQIQHQDALLKQLTSCAGIPQKIIQLAEQISEGALENNEVSWLKTRLPALLLMSALLITLAALSVHLQPILFNLLKSNSKAEPLIESDTSLLEEKDTSQLVKNDILPKSTASEVEELAGSWSNKVIAEIKESQEMVGISDSDVGVARVIISEQEIANLAEYKEESPVDVTQVTKVKESANVSSVDKLKNVVDVVDVVDNTQPIDSDITPLDMAQAGDGGAIKTESSLVANMQNGLFTASSQLLAVAPAHFTLQISAMASKESLQRFAVEHNLPQKNVYIYQTTHNNKPWYVVILGEYESRASAKRASETLSGSFINMDTWIKKYQLVHQDLRLNNE